jgi:hypothetical protein
MNIEKKISCPENKTGIVLVTSLMKKKLNKIRNIFPKNEK